ncbi:hypothetical protein [Sphingomonas sp. 3P27F8]|nr:hypothetical protein [Sphingomonas sp. 3P27F8]
MRKEDEASRPVRPVADNRGIDRPQRISAHLAVHKKPPGEQEHSARRGKPRIEGQLTLRSGKAVSDDSPA